MKSLLPLLFLFFAVVALKPEKISDEISIESETENQEKKGKVPLEPFTEEQGREMYDKMLDVLRKMRQDLRKEGIKVEDDNEFEDLMNNLKKGSSTERDSVEKTEKDNKELKPESNNKELKLEL